MQNAKKVLESLWLFIKLILENSISTSGESYKMNVLASCYVELEKSEKSNVQNVHKRFCQYVIRVN